MPIKGNGSTQYTVSGIPITGTLNVTCQYSGPVTDANLPTCTYGPLHSPMARQFPPVQSGLCTFNRKPLRLRGRFYWGWGSGAGAAGGGC